MATTVPHHAPSAHDLMGFHRRLAQEILRPFTTVETGNAVDLALCYARLIAAAQRQPVAPRALSINFDSAGVWPTSKVAMVDLTYAWFGGGVGHRSVPFFRIAHPTLAVLGKLHGGAVAILDAALGYDTQQRDDDPLTPGAWRTLSVEAIDGGHVEARCAWDASAANAMPWYLKLV